MTARITLDECRSYATVENLRRALQKYGLEEYRHIECRNAEGRWTAVFSFGDAQRMHGQCYLGFASQYGFMTTN